MKRLLKYTLIALAAILVLPAGIPPAAFHLTADMEQPAVTIDTAAYRVTDHGGYAVCHGSFLRRNPHGLWELYTAGSPEESGAAAGALTAGLMHYQEQVFVDRIREFVPSEGYLKFLGGMIRIFNRNLGRHVPRSTGARYTPGRFTARTTSTPSAPPTNASSTTTRRTTSGTP